MGLAVITWISWHSGSGLPHDLPPLPVLLCNSLVLGYRLHTLTRQESARVLSASNGFCRGRTIHQHIVESALSPVSGVFSIMLNKERALHSMAMVQSQASMAMAHSAHRSSSAKNWEPQFRHVKTCIARYWLIIYNSLQIKARIAHLPVDVTSSSKTHTSDQ